MYKNLIIGLALSLITLFSWAGDLPMRWFTINGGQVILHVHLFTVSTCPYCQKAETFLNHLALNNSWLEIHHYVINTDKQALVTFSKFLQEQKTNDFSVPAIFFCNARWVGFKDSEKSGAQLLAGLNYCREQISKAGQLSTATMQTLKQLALANWYEGSLATPPLSPSFMPFLAMVDALNPSITILIFAFIAFLISLFKQTRQSIILISFLLGAGIAHYFQLAYLSFFYTIMPLLRPVAVFVGLGLVLFILIVIKKYKKSLSTIKMSSLIFLTALVIQSYIQINNYPNFALIVKQWLVSQQYNVSKQAFYQFIYVLVYLITLTLGALAVVLLLRLKRLQNYLPVFKRLGESFLLTVGLILIIYPYELNRLFFIFIIVGLSVLIAWILPKFYHVREKSF